MFVTSCKVVVVTFSWNPYCSYWISCHNLTPQSTYTPINVIVRIVPYKIGQWFFLCFQVSLQCCRRQWSKPWLRRNWQWSSVQRRQRWWPLWINVHCPTVVSTGITPVQILTRFHIFRTLCFFHVFLFFVWLPSEKACSRLVCPGFDVGGGKGMLELEYEWLMLTGEGGQGWGGLLLSGLILSISQPTWMALVTGFYARL